MDHDEHLFHDDYHNDDLGDHDNHDDHDIHPVQVDDLDHGDHLVQFTYEQHSTFGEITSNFFTQ